MDSSANRGEEKDKLSSLIGSATYAKHRADNSCGIRASRDQKRDSETVLVLHLHKNVSRGTV